VVTYNNLIMMKISRTIVFFGSGPVAAKSLEALLKSFTIEAVITKPRPPHHKGIFPVLDVAAKAGLPILTVANRNQLDEVLTQTSLQSEVAILIDFGIIVSQYAIEQFPLGIVNSHFSLLPEWRGADPITFSVLSGQKQTGVSLMLLTEKMDEGNLLAQATYSISANITTPSLTEDLIELSVKTLEIIIPDYVSNQLQAIPQSGTPTYSRKLTKQDGVLDWGKPAEQLEREVRAFLEWPKSRGQLGGKEIIVTKAHIEHGSGRPGAVWRDGKQLGVYTKKDILVIDKLKLAGKAEMTAEAFLAGYAKYL